MSSPFSTESVFNTLQCYARSSDEKGILTPEQLSICHSQGWFRMLAPVYCGGAELSLPEATRLEEAIARADGNVGWLVTLCAGASWFLGFLENEIAGQIMGKDQVCIAGSGVPSGSAKKYRDGYLVNGRWRYATRADVATHFTFNALIAAEEEPSNQGVNSVDIKSFIVPASQVKVIRDWRAIGLRGSSTHTFVISNLYVTNRQCFTMDAQMATIDSPLYRFPFLPMALATFAANICGMASTFLEQALTIIEQRAYPMSNKKVYEVEEVQTLLAAVQQNLAARRRHFYHQLDRSWEKVCKENLDRQDAIIINSAAIALTDTCREAVDQIYPLCGLQAADFQSDLNRMWRDFHTATQHPLLLPGIEHRV